MIYRNMRRAALAVVLILATSPVLYSGTLIVTRAMLATSIAEIFVQQRL